MNFLPGLGCSGPWVGGQRGKQVAQGGDTNPSMGSLGRQAQVSHLDTGGDVVDNPDGFGVGVARQGMGDEVKLHLPRGLCPRLLPINGLTGGALQAAILHRHQGDIRDSTQPPSTHPGDA